jgi:hypothetical protein
MRTVRSSSSRLRLGADRMSSFLTLTSRGIWESKSVVYIGGGCNDPTEVRLEGETSAEQFSFCSGSAVGFDPGCCTEFEEESAAFELKATASTSSVFSCRGGSVSSINGCVGLELGGIGLELGGGPS